MKKADDKRKTIKAKAKPIIVNPKAKTVETKLIQLLVVNAAELVSTLVGQFVRSMLSLLCSTRLGCGQECSKGAKRVQLGSRRTQCGQQG